MGRKKNGINLKETVKIREKNLRDDDLQLCFRETFIFCRALAHLGVRWARQNINGGAVILVLSLGWDMHLSSYSASFSTGRTE